jgi:hypothetical protein
VLELRIPIAESAKARKVQITADGDERTIDAPVVGGAVES